MNRMSERQICLRNSPWQVLREKRRVWDNVILIHPFSVGGDAMDERGNKRRRKKREKKKRCRENQSMESSVLTSFRVDSTIKIFSCAYGTYFTLNISSYFILLAQFKSFKQIKWWFTRSPFTRSVWYTTRGRSWHIRWSELATFLTGPAVLDGIIATAAICRWQITMQIQEYIKELISIFYYE